MDGQYLCLPVGVSFEAALVSSVKNLVISLSICKSFLRGDPTVSSSNCNNSRNTGFQIK